MSYHLQNKKTPARSRKVLLLFVVVALLLLAGNYFSGGVVAQYARVPAAALWGTGGVFSDTFGSVGTYFAQKKELEQERDILKERVRELELYALNNMVLASENAELRRLLGTGEDRISRGVLARVLSRGGEHPFGSMVISRESDADYTVGSRVYGEQSFLLGRIAQASPNNATVRLVSAYGEETDVLIGTEDRITQATVRGAGHGNMMTEVARDVDIRVGDPVVLFAEETSIVGYVGDVETKPSSAFQVVRVRTPINLESIRFVRVR